MAQWYCFSHSVVSPHHCYSNFPIVMQSGEHWTRIQRVWSLSFHWFVGWAWGSPNIVCFLISNRGGLNYMTSRAFPGSEIQWFWKLRFAREWSFYKFQKKNNKFLLTLRNKGYCWHTSRAATLGADNKSRIEAWVLLPPTGQKLNNLRVFTPVLPLPVSQWGMLINIMALFGLEGPWEVFASFSWPLVRMVPKVPKPNNGVECIYFPDSLSDTHTVLPTEGLFYSLEISQFVSIISFSYFSTLRQIS